MTILFWKLLAHKELKEQAEYILNSRDPEYTLENFIISNGYNPIEKLKELEDDLDSQLLIPEIIDLFENRSNSTRSLEESIEFFRKLDDTITERFKFYGVFILKEIYNYLSKKEKNELKENKNN